MASFITTLDRIRQTAHRFRRAPMFTLITLVTLAIGVGANTAIFSVIEGVLLKPLPYPDPDRLISLWYTAPGIGIKDLNIAPAVYFIDREQNTTLQDVGVYNGDAMTVTGTGTPEHVAGLDVTARTLPMLGIKPALGRLFTEADDSAGHPQTILITDAYWRKHFNSDPSAVGSMATVDGHSMQVIGVLSRDFQFLDFHDISIIEPFQWDRAKTKLGNFSYSGIARLKPGVTIEQANADMARLLPVTVLNFPPPPGFSAKMFEDAGIAPNLRPLKHDVVGDIGKVLWVLMGSLGLVQLIACANVANLMLVRVEARRQELAVRAALGAGRGQIAADLFTESLLLGAVGSLLGLGLAYGALQALVAAAPTGLPRLGEIGIDPLVLLFTLGLAIFTSLLIGVLPVMRYAGGRASSGLSLSLRGGSRGQSQSREQHRTRNALVVLQVAMALKLLICSGLMIRTFYALMHVDPGFRAPESVQTFRVAITQGMTPDFGGLRLTRMEQAMRDKLAAIPGVEAVSFGSSVPMDGSASNDVVYAQDRAYAEGHVPPIRRFKFIAPGFFSTLGTPLIAGRDYTWQDSYEKLPVAIVSENFAREYWHDAANALGKRIRVGSANDDWREIVGVVANTHDDGLHADAPTAVYWPVLMGAFEGEKERSEPFIEFVLRTPRAGSEALMKEAEQAIWGIDSNLPLSNIHTLGYYYSQSMARTSFTLVLLSIAGAMALLLGIVGIFGVISYAVSQRTREIGIRMALGAQRAEITGMFVRQGFVLTSVGVVFGLAASFATMRLMSSLLFHVSPADPLTYAGITASIVAISWVACYLPSRRAASVEPVDALRSE